MCTSLPMPAHAHAFMHAHTHAHVQAHIHVHTQACVRTRTHMYMLKCIHTSTYGHTHIHILLCTRITIVKAIKYSHCHINYITYLFCTNIWSISACPIAPGSMIRAQPVAPMARIRPWTVAPGTNIRGCGWSPVLCGGPHGEWPSMHLFWNNAKIVRDTMPGIFVKGPWYSTFITAKYEYSTQNSFSVKSKFAGKCR